MPMKRKIEVFSAGCSCCFETIELVRKSACPSCEVTVLDMRNPEVAERARHWGIRSVPAVGLMAGWRIVVPRAGPKWRRCGRLAWALH